MLFWKRSLPTTCGKFLASAGTNRQDQPSPSPEAQVIPLPLHRNPSKTGKYTKQFFFFSFFFFPYCIIRNCSAILKSNKWKLFSGHMILLLKFAKLSIIFNKIVSDSPHLKKKGCNHLKKQFLTAYRVNPKASCSTFSRKISRQTVGTPL